MRSRMLSQIECLAEVRRRFVLPFEGTSLYAPNIKRCFGDMSLNPFVVLLIFRY